MDERWKCPNCGFHNDDHETYCVSCDTPRPDDSAVETPDETMDSPVFTSYLRDLDYEPKPLDLPLYAPRPEYEEPPESIPGSLPMPTLEPLTSPPPVTKPTRPALDEITKALEYLKRPKSQTTSPPSRKSLVSLTIIIALVGIAVAIVANVASRDTTSSATSVTDLSIVVSQEDDIYFEELAQINQMRNDLIDVTNARWDAWLALESDAFPTAEYLVMDELATFQASVQSMTLPVSDEARALHDAWTADLNSLVLAEQALVTNPDQATLDAELEAWHTEDASYTALYEYMQARE